MRLTRRYKLAAFILIFIAAALLSGNTLYYLNFDPTYGFLRHKQEAVAGGWYLPAFYTHIFAGAVVLVAGFFQFWKKLRRAFPKIHRFIGYIYAFGILLLAAPGGMVMAFFIGRGPIVLSSFVLQCSLWVAFTILAMMSAWRGSFLVHERWMMRSFALTLAAITLRLYIFGASWFFDLSAPAVYGIFAWMSWIPNIVLAEVLIRKKITSPPTRKTSAGSLLAN